MCILDCLLFILLLLLFMMFTLFSRCYCFRSVSVSVLACLWFLCEKAAKRIFENDVMLKISAYVEVIKDTKIKQQKPIKKTERCNKTFSIKIQSWCCFVKRAWRYCTRWINRLGDAWLFFSELIEPSSCNVVTVLLINK